MSELVRGVILNYAVCALFGGVAGFLAPERAKKTVRALAVAVMLCALLLPLRGLSPPSFALPEAETQSSYDALMHAVGTLEAGVRDAVRRTMEALEIHEYEIFLDTETDVQANTVALTELRVEIGEAYAEKIPAVRKALAEYGEVLTVCVKGS